MVAFALVMAVSPPNKTSEPAFGVAPEMPGQSDRLPRFRRLIWLCFLSLAVSVCLPREAWACPVAPERRSKLLAKAEQLTANVLKIVHSSRPEDALAPARRALAIRQKALGPGHPDTAISLNNLGVVYGALGDLKQARLYHQQALSIQEIAPGVQGADLAMTLSNLGIVLAEMGHPEAARPYLERALETRESFLGPEHAGTAQSLNNLGALLWDGGEQEIAVGLFERALTVLDKALGPWHPETLASLDNLVYIHQTLGDREAAITYLERFLKIREAMLGTRYPEVATHLNNLASLLFEKGELAAAQSHLERALGIRETALGRQHPETATILNNLGFLLTERGDLETAEIYLHRALMIAEALPAESRQLDIPTILGNLGKLFHIKGDLNRAQTYFERALRIRQATLGPRHLGTATSLQNLGDLLRVRGDFETARFYLQRALEILESAVEPDDRETAVYLNNLGLLLQDEGDLRGARSRFESALKLMRNNSPRTLDMAQLVNNLGYLLLQLGDLEAAQRHLERTVQDLGQMLGPEHPKLAVSLNNLGLVFKAVGDFEAAERCLERSWKIQEKNLNLEHPGIINVINNSGKLIFEMGGPRTAERYFSQALRLAKKLFGIKHPTTALVLRNLGAVRMSRGDFVGARGSLEQALRIQAERIGDRHPTTALTLLSLGRLLQSQGNLEGARLYLERALEIQEKALGRGHPAIADSLNLFGSLLLEDRDLEGAASYLSRALRIREEVLGPEHPAVAASLSNLGLLLQDRGEMDQARNCFDRALMILEKIHGPDHPATAVLLNNLGLFFHETGDFENSRIHFERALGILDSVLGPRHAETIAALINLGNLYAAIGEIDSALEVIERSLEAQEPLLSGALTIGPDEDRLQLLLRSQLFSGSTGGSVSIHLRSAPENLRAARLAFLTILRRKGRALDVSSEDLRLIRQRMDPEGQELLEKRNELRELQAFLLLNPPRFLGTLAYGRKLQELATRLRQVESELSLRSATFREALAPVTIEAIQAMVPKDAVLVELVVYLPFDVQANDWTHKPRYAAYMLHPSGELRWADLGESEIIDTAVKLFREAIADRRADVRQRARELDLLTMAKVRPMVGKMKRLIVSPDGELQLVPLGALIDETDRYLVERYEISYVTSGRDLLRFGGTTANREASLVVGDADFGASPGSAPSHAAFTRANEMASLRFERLPGTSEEAKAIGAILGVSDDRILTGRSATEAGVKNVSGPRILHIATHGFFLQDSTESSLRVSLAPNSQSVHSQDPLLRSGLALAGFNRRREAAGANDGVLTALEVAGLDLWGTELVVLSACETGVGDVLRSHGVFGLRRALVLAGSESQVMTLWRVADEPTKELMVSWYEQLIRGRSRAEAMRQVQLAALRGEPLPMTNQPLRGIEPLTAQDSATDPQRIGTTHPYYWASLIVSGQTGPLRGTTGDLPLSSN